MVSSCTCVQVTCHGSGVTGDGCGMTKSHPQCDLCHTLILGTGLFTWDVAVVVAGITECGGGGGTHGYNLFVRR